jgi:hypothetical protein
MKATSITKGQGIARQDLGDILDYLKEQRGQIFCDLCHVHSVNKIADHKFEDSLAKTYKAVILKSLTRLDDL